MKAAQFVLFALWSAMVVSCSDSHPFTTETPMNAKSTPPSTEPVCPPIQGSILLDTNIVISEVEHGSMDVVLLAALSGQAKYSTNPSPLLAKDHIMLDLSLYAGLSPMAGTDPTWLFSGESRDHIFIPMQREPVFLTKEYHPGNVKKDGGEHGIKLYVRYMVTRCSVTVQTLWIQRTPPRPHSI